MTLRNNPKVPGRPMDQGIGTWPARMRQVLLIFPNAADAEAWDDAGRPLVLPSDDDRWEAIEVEAS